MKINKMTDREFTLYNTVLNAMLNNLHYFAKYNDNLSPAEVTNMLIQTTENITTAVIKRGEADV